MRKKDGARGSLEKCNHLLHVDGSVFFWPYAYDTQVGGPGARMNALTPGRAGVGLAVQLRYRGLAFVRGG